MFSHIIEGQIMNAKTMVNLESLLDSEVIVFRGYVDPVDG